MAEALLVDTDVFVDHLRGAQHLLLDVGDEVSYSVVTRCELFAGSRTDELVVQSLLAPFTERPIGRTIAERAGRIRRQAGTHVADALIAATAIEHGLVLVTRNVRDFAPIAGLRITAPRSS